MLTLNCSPSPLNSISDSCQLYPFAGDNDSRTKSNNSQRRQSTSCCISDAHFGAVRSANKIALMLNEKDDVVDTIFTAPVLLLISSSFDDGAVESAVLVVNSIRIPKYGCAEFELSRLCTSCGNASQFEELKPRDRERHLHLRS